MTNLANWISNKISPEWVRDESSSSKSLTVTNCNAHCSLLFVPISCGLSHFVRDHFSNWYFIQCIDIYVIIPLRLSASLHKLFTLESGSSFLQWISASLNIMNNSVVPIKHQGAMRSRTFDTFYQLFIIIRWIKHCKEKPYHITMEKETELNLTFITSDQCSLFTIQNDVIAREKYCYRIGCPLLAFGPWLFLVIPFP